MSAYYQKLNSPIGEIYIATDGEFLRVLALGKHWDNLKNSLENIKEKEHSILSQTKKQLDEYFCLKRTVFDLPLHFEGTPFQVATWNALLKIPYGKTISYSQQAQMIQNPKAVRAVGRTNGLNPISIIAPCHRVAGKSGKLTGYASGLENKKYLLELEQHITTTYDKNINALIVKMPEKITFEELELWKDRFLLSLEETKQHKNLSLLLDTNQHQFESIMCLKLLRDILSIKQVQNHISKVAMVQPEQYREAKIHSKTEAYFSSFDAAYDWLQRLM